MFRTLGPGDSISVALRKVLQGGRRGSQPLYKFATKGKAVWISKIRYQVKEFSVLFLGRCKPLDSLDSFLPYGSSAIWGQPCFFVHLKEQQMAASCFSSSSAITMGSGSIPWATVLGALTHIWRPEIADGCHISCLLIWQEIFSFHKLMEKTQSCMFFSEMSHHLFLTYSWSPDLDVSFKVGHWLVRENRYSFPYPA